MEDNWKEENFVKYIFQMELLQESYELSVSDICNQIKKAFTCYSTGVKSARGDNLYNLESYASRIIIQAIGRICRTNMKNGNIYIFADKRIADVINPDITEGRIFNFEFISLCEKIKEVQKEYSKPDNFIIKADAVSDKASRYIDNMLNNAWSEKIVYFWKTLRDFVLKFPTMSGQEEDSYMIRSNYFVRLSHIDNKLYYLQSNDFHKIDISFTPKQNYKVLNEEKIRLNLLMKWNPLKEYFTKKGYATVFKPNEYIMSPAVWNNIYKGALGEAVGQFWFLKVLGVNLEKLKKTEIFEFFDFKIPGKQIFVDFKSWSEKYDVQWKETLEKISAKEEKCNCRLVIIANILTD